MITDSRGHLQHYYIGEEGYPQHDVYGDAIMVPRRESRVQAPAQGGGRGIINYPQQELYRPSGPPQSLQPVQGMVVETAMRAQQREIGAHTQVWHKVAEIEQRGGSPTAQSSANRIGPTGWFPTATNNKGKGWVKATYTQITMTRWDITLLPLD
jgi:hypothetical protein